MKTTYVLLPLLFLLLTAGALAAPTVIVDQTVTICEHGKCSNSSTVKAGLEPIAAPLTAGIRTIRVYDLPPRNFSGNVSLTARSEGDHGISFYVRGMNTSTYRALVISTIQHSYQALREKDAQVSRAYPLPSWAPRPGQCDHGIKVRTSRGGIVCTR